MFDYVHKNARIMQFVLFLLIVPSFAFVGLDGYNRMLNAGEDVAKVDGRGIKQTELDAAYKNEIERIRAANPSVDVKLIDTPEAKYATL